MSGKDRRKYHGTHRIHQRPRNWARVFREGWLEEDRPALRRQRALLRTIKIGFVRRTRWPIPTNQAAELVKLRYFGGLTAQEAAELLGISERTAERLWAFGRSWLMKEIRGV
jgi:hypothetical protein